MSDDMGAISGCAGGLGRTGRKRVHVGELVRKVPQNENVAKSCDIDCLTNRRVK